MDVWNHAWLNHVVCVPGRTSNSQWQETVDGLPAGCAFYDAPEVPCRVFKGKLEALLQGLRCGSIWGPRTLVSDVDGERVYKYQVHGRTGGSGYLIYVIEFQSRGLPHAHIVARPMDMPAGSECFGGAEPGTAQAWVDEFVCARKPTRDVLVEYGMLQLNGDGDAEVTTDITMLPFATKRELFPRAGLTPNKKINPTPMDVMEEMQKLVTGERRCMDGYGTFYGRGPMEHGPHPGHGHRPCKMCDKNGKCKVSWHCEHAVRFGSDGNMLCSVDVESLSERYRGNLRWSGRVHELQASEFEGLS